MTTANGTFVHPAGALFTYDPAALSEVDDFAKHRRVERFIYDEATLLDTHRRDEWFALFAEDAYYWVPLVEEAASPFDALNLIFDDRNRLDDRLYRYETGTVWSQEPLSRTSRVVSNLVINEGGDHYATVTSRYIMAELRPTEERIFSGSLLHVLDEIDGTLKIRAKRASITSSQTHLPSVTFLL